MSSGTILALYAFLRDHVRSLDRCDLWTDLISSWVLHMPVQDLVYERLGQDSRGMMHSCSVSKTQESR